MDMGSYSVEERSRITSLGWDEAKLLSSCSSDANRTVSPNEPANSFSLDWTKRSVVAAMITGLLLCMAKLFG